MTFDLKAWIVTHKPEAALGAGAVGAVGIGLYRKRKNAATSSTASNNQVPTDATTAAAGGYVPYGGSDVAGGVPFDPSAFNADPSGYLAQISQGISDLNTTDAALGAALGDAVGGGMLSPGGAGKNPDGTWKGPIKAKGPHTGGKVTKPAKSPKPTKKPPKHPRAKAKAPAPPPPVRNPRRPTNRPKTTKPIKPTPMQPRRRR